MTVSASAVLALLTFFCGIGVTLLGYFSRGLAGLDARTNQLEQASAAHEADRRTLAASVCRIETKLDRALERGYRPPQGSEVDI